MSPEATLGAPPNVVSDRMVANQNGAETWPKKLRKAGWLMPNHKGLSYYVALGHWLEALGWQGDLQQLMDMLPSGESSVSRYEFEHTLALLDFELQRKRIHNLSKLDAELPCLFSPDGDKNKLFLLLKRNRNNSLNVFDTEKQVNATIHDLAQSGTLMTLKERMKDDEATRHAKKRLKVSWFQEKLESFQSSLLIILSASLIVNFMALITPIFVMVVYNQIIGAVSISALTYLFAGGLIAIGLEVALRLIRGQLIARFGARLNYLVSHAVMERLLRLPSIYTERSSVASQLARVKAFESVRDAITGPMLLAMLELPFVVILAFAIGLIAGPLVWVTVGYIISYSIILLLMRQRMRRYNIEAAKVNGERERLVIETIEKLEALKHNGLTTAWLDRLLDNAEDVADSNFRAQFSGQVMEHLSHALTLIAVMMTITIGVQLVWAGSLSIGGLTAVMILTWRILNPLQTICAVLPRLEQVRNSVGQINRLMNIPTEPMPHLTAPLVGFKGHMQFTNVTFRYSKEVDPVVVGLNLEAKPGTLTAIVGSNGSGKSTVLKLAQGLYTPGSGAIRIDNTDIRQMIPIEVRRHITYLPQMPPNLEMNIIQYLRLRNPTLSEESALEALSIFRAKDEIQQLKGGLYTNIGKSGIKLSSNLNYRIHLAQLYVSTNNIILCDELPYALLNSQTGEDYRTFLKRMKGDRTVFFVTHRKDFIELADQVVVLRADKRPIVTTPEKVKDWM